MLEIHFEGGKIVVGGRQREGTVWKEEWGGKWARVQDQVWKGQGR